MSIRNRIYLGLFAGFVLAAILSTVFLFVAWRHNGWDLNKNAQLGETVAPIVGILTLLAVGAAIWSVRVQQDALEHQRRSSTEQQGTVNAQLELQRQTLEHQKQELLQQRQALEEELRYRRHAALREAYGPFLTAVASYLDTLHEYHRQMLRRPEADHRIRSDWQHPCKETHREIGRRRDAVILVDTSEERGDHRLRLSREIHLEPGVDTPENVKDWNDVILDGISELTDHFVALREALQKEFGADIPPKRPEAVASKNAMRKDLKARANAVEWRVMEQLKEIVKDDAIRTGRWKPPTPDTDDRP